MPPCYRKINRAAHKSRATRWERNVMKRFIAIAAALGLFAACSTADEGDGTSPPTTAAATTTTVPTDADAATVAEIAGYEGADRQQVLEEGARREGSILSALSHSWLMRHCQS